MTNTPHIVFSGGVTGGHLFPGLAVADQILRQAPAARITFCGPGGALDRREVERAGYAYLELPCPRAPNRFWRFPRFAQRMLLAQRAAAQFLHDGEVSAVVGLGGFASAPVALAAARNRTPLILMEQNAVLGRANRWLARWAQAICLAFDDTEYAPGAARRHTHVTGTPIRSAFSTPPQKPCGVLLVLGGSGGARALNEAMPRAIASLQGALSEWRVIHQTGANAQAATEAAYGKAGCAATVVPFLEDMPAVLASTELAVCRAGGSTLAELAVTNTPAMLVPFVQAADDHQRQNARRFQQAGAATLVDSRGLLSEELQLRLREELSRLLADRAERDRMAQAMATIAQPDAAERVAEIVLGYASDKSSRRPGASLRQRTSRPAISPPLPTLD